MSDREQNIAMFRTVFTKIKLQIGLTHKYKHISESRRYVCTFIS